ncbi:formate C-acetyltransferase/glycerol dehydratase family glycyl radical enzyme [Desulfosarcina sp.]|uniref:glycyl radical protein n=1 Tax=Desulfosarcina sp. TaxID=2027861 RepID=UPI00356AD5E2
MLTPRLERLKNQIVNAKPEVYAERALLVTQAYQENENEPLAIQKARAMEKVFRQSTVLIKDDELIVGCKTPTALGSPLYPEFNVDWLKKEIDSLSQRYETAFDISEENKNRVKQEVIPFWEGRTIYDRILPTIPANAMEAADEGALFHYYLNRSIGHFNPNYETVLKEGFDGLRYRVEHALQGTTPEDAEKQNYYKALLIVIHAVVAFAHRYADEAEKMAQSCRDPERKNELLQIANNCRWVPEHPPQTYWQAIQSFWFTHLMLNLESNAYALSPGRFDQYIYPFYRKDMAEKATTRADAQELLNCLWVKFAEMTVVKEAGTAKASNTYADFQNLNVGGLKADGSDGVNDISYMCIEAQSALLLPQPQLSCLISSKSPHAFLLKACELARQGTGMPAMFNADEIVLSLTEKGKSLEDARNGGINGCVEITGQGNDQMASSGYINLAKCLELALNNGTNMISGKQLGPQTGTPDQFRSIEDVWQALEAQIRHMVDLKHQFDTAAKLVFARSCPALCTSLVVDDCIKKGKDFHNGGARYSQPMLSGVGTGTVTDAIAAIDHFVFGKGTFSTGDIVQAMKDNFDGHETMRNLLWNKAPKLGNDRDEVDRNAARLVNLFVKLLKDYTNDRGVPYAADMIPTTAHLPFGVLTAASADGRLAGAPLAEGISPVQGQDLSGPTAVVKSIAKLDHVSTVGSLLNMKFTPQTLAGEDNLKKFAALIRTYFDYGGHHMQFNVVSRETLIEAQQYPDDYRSLLIRVAGYSDYFVMLSKDVQDEVISRTAHEVC